MDHKPQQAEQIQPIPKKVRKKDSKGCLRTSVTIIKILLVLTALILTGIAGGFIANSIKDQDLATTRDELNDLSMRESDLVATVDELETQVNQLLTENSELREQLNIEADRQKDSQTVDFTAQALGKRVNCIRNEES